MSSLRISTQSRRDSTNKELRKLEGRFNFFVSQAMAVITIVDRDGTIVYQSPSVKQILGYDHTTRIGKNFLYSRLVHQDDVPVKEKLFAKTLKYPQKNFRGELRMRHKKGTWSWMEVLFNNQIDNPTIGGIIVVTHDITERKLSELRKDEFLSIASHELKTPMTAIRAYSELLLAKMIKKDLSEELTFVGNIVLQTDKITHLISELLDISKIQEKKLSVQTHPFALQTIIKNIIHDFSYISSSHTIILKSSSKELVLGDEGRIAQVITNLLTNAIKYSPKANKILIQLTQKGNEIITSVTDFGVGIPLNKQQYVFQRFYRIDESNAQQISSGLGLYIASEIIKMHKGKMWVQSSIGKGSTFYFSLPIAKKIV